MIFVIELERFISSASVYCIIICKFGSKLKLSLVILFVIDKDFKISFFYIILPLSLAISPRLQSNERFQLNTKKIILKKPKL